jgi:futalosine hydrolase
LESSGKEAGNASKSSGSPEASPVALIAAVAMELDPLRAELQSVRHLRIGGRETTVGLLNGHRVVMIVGGMGKVNAAQTTTALLEQMPVRAVINFGVAGSYLNAGPAVAGLALATSEVYGDEGVDTLQGWLSTEEIGIPLAESAGTRLFNRFPVDPELVAAAAERLDAGGLPFVGGPFVTVSCCSGTERRGAELQARFGAICESMEGAAVAHVCALYGVPFLEIRGVSNLVEDRQLANWQLERAATAAAKGARALVDVFVHPIL